LLGGGLTTSARTSAITYITIATTGNSVDFGNLTQARQRLAACSNSTRGVFAGGEITAGNVNTMDYVTIASESNATDFGDLTILQANLAGCSNSSGGVQ